MSFSNSEIVKLLSLIENSPIIYDTSHSQHNNAALRELAWKDVAVKMKKKVKACKLRWVHLRDSLRRKFKQRILNPGRDNKYRYEDKMAFIVPFFQKIDVSYVVDDEFDADNSVADNHQDKDFDDVAKFTTFEDLKLIKTVKERIYETNNYKSMDHRLSLRVWVEIGEILQKPASHCKLRWANMRDAFRRKIKLRRQMKDKQKSLNFKYKYEKEMAFLIPYFSYLPNSESLDDSDSQNDSEEEEDRSVNEFGDEEEEKDVKFEFTPVEEFSFEESKRSPDKQEEVPKKRYKLLKEDDYDDVDTFLLSIGSTMKKLKPFYKNQVKSNIFELVQEYELKQIAETESL